jgi:hypothetical protein
MFGTHKLNENGFAAVKSFKTAMSLGISLAMKYLPEGRDKAIFKTKLEEAVFFGTRAIAAEKKNHLEIIDYPEAE